MIRGGLRLGLLAVAGSLLLACQTVVPPAPRVPLDARDPRYAGLVRDWNERAALRTAMRGNAHIAVEPGPAPFRSRLVLERPASLRVEVVGPFGQSVGLLVTDGERYELLEVGSRHVEAGPVHAGLLYEQTRLDLTPSEALDLLLGAPTLDPTLRVKTATGVGPDTVVLELADEDGRVREVVSFDGAGRMQSLELLDGNGGSFWEARFGDYRELGSEAYAHRLEIEIAAGESRAQIELSEVELEPDLDPALFRLPGRARIGVSSE